MRHNAIGLFLNGIVDYGSLNILVVLDFICKKGKNDTLLKDILNEIGNVSIDDFKLLVSGERQCLEKLTDDDTGLFLRHLSTGKALHPTQGYPVSWMFMALYWAYGFDKKKEEVIGESFNPRIVDSVLRILLAIHNTKRREVELNWPQRSLGFYSDLIVKVVRAIEFLINIDQHGKQQTRRLYLHISTGDVVEHFIRMVAKNRFEAEAYSTGKTNARKLMVYSTEDEYLTVVSSRMVKDNYLADMDLALDRLHQLYNGESPKTSRHRSHIKGKTAIKEVKVPEVVTDPIDEAVIWTPLPVSPKTIERDSEHSARKIQRRHDPVDGDNHYRRHKQNRAFSANFQKQNLLLPSDYHIPPVPLLTDFIASLPAKMEIDRYCKLIFAIACVTGIRVESILAMLLESKGAIHTIKDGRILVKIDTDIFSSDLNSDFLCKSVQEIEFELPRLATMAIAKLKRETLTTSKTMREEELAMKWATQPFTIHSPLCRWSLSKSFERSLYGSHDEVVTHGLKRYLKRASEQFLHTIPIQLPKTPLYLQHFLTGIDMALHPTWLATSAYGRNERSKLAYTSTPKKSSIHAQGVKAFWNALRLDLIVPGLVGAPGNIYNTEIFTISENEYTGSKKVLDTKHTRTFFKELRRAIAIRDTYDDSYFNLVSIYLRNAMGILIGLRDFQHSADFDSYSQTFGLISINEKSNDLALGLRIIPVCATLKKILSFYMHLLDKRGFSYAPHLIIDQTPTIWSAKSAYFILESMSNLENKELLMQYVMHTPLNAGRHLFMQRAQEWLIPQSYIDAYMGHYFTGAEQLGIFATMSVPDYSIKITELTESLARECAVEVLL